MATMSPQSDLTETHTEQQPDVAEHERTFRVFAKGMAIFAAHVMVILGLLAAATL